MSISESDSTRNEKPRRNILFLGLVSLFTDLSSEMVYPLVPVFLAGLGTNKAIIGLIEGIAEAVAALFRTVFGHLSDRFRKRKLFIYLGYCLSAFCKPFLYLAQAWPAVLGVRFADRLGKAIRTPARDALISTSINATEKGRAFGIHRAMDTLGAIIGPLLAMFVLALFNNNIRFVFLFSFIPAIIALVFIRLVRETKIERIDKITTGQAYNIRNMPFMIFLVANVIFTLGNSSNAFLILKARETGLSIAMIPVIWVVYNCLYAITSPVFGSLSDSIGRKPFIIFSFVYYSAVYFLFGMAQNPWQIWILFGAYGIYYGMSEGIFRAYIADLVEEERRATAYGIFNTGIGLALFPASLIMGIIWDAYGSKWAFLVSAGFSLLGFLIFLASLLINDRGDNGKRLAP